MRYAAMIAILLLAGCTQLVPVEVERSLPPLAEAAFNEAALAGAIVYRIDPHASRILVRVGRAGRMGSLGHDHAVASRDVQGLVAIAMDLNLSFATVVFPLRNLIVDAAADRERLGLDSAPSANDIAGTYSNMFRMLEPASFPWAELHARVVSSDHDQVLLAVSITLHGSVFEYEIPVDLEHDAARLLVRGRANLRHSDFGLTPVAAAGGLVRVADAFEVDFLLVGEPR